MTEMKTVAVSSLLSVNDVFEALLKAIVAEVLANLPADLAVKLDELEESIIGLQARCEALETKLVSNVEKQLADVAQRIEDFDNELKAVRGDILDIERSDAIDGSHESRMDDIEERLYTLESNNDDDNVVDTVKDVVRRALTAAIDEL